LNEIAAGRRGTRTPERPQQANELTPSMVALGDKDAVKISQNLKFRFNSVFNDTRSV
jgi:hypothetical protein